MGNYEDWAELRMFLIEAFNGTIPTPQAETDIIRAYELHPGTLEKIAVDIAGQYASGGDITSPWGLLHYKAGKINTPPSNPSRPSSVTREKALQRTDQWLHNAGLYHDQTEAILHLCDHKGMLHTYAQAELVNDGPGTPARLEVAGDPTVIAHIRQQHTIEHPRGLAADQAAHARAEAWKEQQRTQQKPNNPAAPNAASPTTDTTPTAKEPPRTTSTPHPAAHSSAPSPPPARKEHPRPNASTPDTSEPSTPTEPSTPRTSTSTPSSPSSTPSKPPTPTGTADEPTTTPPSDSTTPSPASSPNLENTPL